MLLLRRSRVIEVYLVFIAAHLTTSQEYEYDTEDNDYYSPEYSDDHTHPDYTKYFGGPVGAEAVESKNTIKNLKSSGFVDPAEFESFFSSPLTNFGEPSEKTAPQNLAPQTRDFFEESQKKPKNLQKQKAESSEIPPGPNYVSHQIPIPEDFSAEYDGSEAQSKDDVETVPPPLLKKSNKKKLKIKPARAGFDGYLDSHDAFETLRKAEEQIDQSKVDPTYYGGKHVDYSTGKSSSTVSQYPSADGFIGSYKSSAATVDPYEKYSYQPENFATTARPLKNTESASLSDKKKNDGLGASSENVPESLKDKDCRKIISPEAAEDMECFVCEDAINRAKYTQCSYASASNVKPVQEYVDSPLRYSLPIAKPRTKRSPRRSSKKGRYSEDPYFQVSERNRKYFDDFERQQEAEESRRQKEFHYSPYDDDYAGYSESQSSELLKEPGACEKVEREGMTCTVCKDAKKGGNFEQCSYTSAPSEQKYAYVAEKKYDSDEPEESKVVTKQSSEEPHQSSSSAQISQKADAPANNFSSATKSKIVTDAIPELTAAGTTVDEISEDRPETEEDDDEESDDESDEEESDESQQKRKQKKADDDIPSYYNYGELKKDKKLVEDDPYEVPRHFAASINSEQTPEDDGEEESFDDYHYKLFPEFNPKGRDNEQKGDASEQNPQDVEEVLAEFAKKDRSNCKKAEKNGMTCFLCVDKNKVQHEECMYIAESKPKPTHIAYHEVQRLKDPKGENQPLTKEQSDESKKVETSVTQQPFDILLPSQPSKKKRFFKKVTSTPSSLGNYELKTAASRVYRTVVPYEKEKKRNVKDSKASGSAPDSERLEEEEPEPEQEQDLKGKASEESEAPKEIETGDEEGAYAQETKPIYSKLFDTVLPRYMVEKTEFEKEFDAVAGFE